MKLLIVASSLQIGGEQRVLSILTNSFVKKDIDVTIYSLTRKPEKQFVFNDRVRIIYNDNSDNGIKNFKRIKKIRKLITENEYDVVLGFAMIPSVLCSFAAFGKCPVIVTERNDPRVYSNKMKIIRYVAYHLCNKGIFQTNDAAEYFPFIKNKVIISNPLNMEVLPEVYQGERDKRIVNTSRLVPEKNQAMLVRAFASLHKKYPEYRLAFYGDGPEKNELLALGKELGIENKMEIYPATNKVLNIIKKDSIFVLTSNHEGFPNSLAEALALGIPSISTDCRIGGPKEMIDSGKNGLLFPVGDTTALTSKLDELMGSSELQNKFTRESQCIREKLSDDLISDRWIEEIKKVVRIDKVS